MTITSNGINHIADQVGLRTLEPICYIAIGTGTPGANALGAELKVRGATITRVNNVVTYHAHWDIDDQFADTITEVGLFYNASGTKVMVASGTCSVVKAINDTLNVNWTYTFSN